MISHKHKSIFIHIPKAAGTSVEKFLRQVDPEIPSKVLRKRGFSKFFNDHLDYYVFSFVRNPYDRFVSAWKWGELQYRVHPDIEFYQKKRSVSFDEYVQLTVDDEYRMFNKDLWSEYDSYHTLPQFEFFPHLNGGHYFTDKIDSDFTCDFIGRFENLHEDFNKVCINIGIKELKLPHAYNSKNFKEEFKWSDLSRDKIYNYYKKDFELFYPGIEQ